MKRTDFDLWVIENHKRLVERARKRGGQDTDDLVQQVYARMLPRLAGVRDPEALFMALFRSALSNARRGTARRAVAGRDARVLLGEPAPGGERWVRRKLAAREREDEGRD